MYSSKPAASLIVNDLVAERGLGKPTGRRRLNEAGQQAVDLTAQRLVALVDQVLGKEGRGPAADRAVATLTHHKPRQATCSCGSGIPVQTVVIDGKTVEILALPHIFQKFRSANRGRDESDLQELIEIVKIYNAVPPEAEGSYREAILREYAAYCQREVGA